MTPDGISTDDWNRVHGAACEIVNASFMDDPVLLAHHTSVLFNVLDDLERDYGRVPSLLATRADFSDDPREAIPLLEEALLASSDSISSRLALQSLVRLMIEGEFNEAMVEARLSELENLSDFEADPSDFEEADELRSAFKKRKWSKEMRRNGGKDHQECGAED